jgi:hypothetical protein
METIGAISGSLFEDYFQIAKPSSRNAVKWRITLK